MKKIVLLVMSAIIVVLLMAGLLGLHWYHNSLGPVSEKSELIEVEVTTGSTYATLGDLLESKNLIQSKFSYRIYLKLNPPKESLKAGIYYLSEDMGVAKILEIFSDGRNSINSEQIKITFKEGINMRAFSKLIAENTNHEEEEVFALLKDQEYLKTLVEQYWFIDDNILNDKLYYSLEGYLFPDTYYFASKDVSVKEIIKTLLEQMGKKLEPFKEKIEASEYNAHELLTLASIIELESADKEHRGKVSGVFYNRLKDRMSLGSDPTTYYGLKVEISDRELTREEFNTPNDYNTRASAMSGKLPIGPICMPSMSSIEAAIVPTKTDAYYFVADKNGVTYFTKTYQEHLAKIEELKASGLWSPR